MTTQNQQSTGGKILGAALFFLGLVPSLLLGDGVMGWFGLTSVGAMYMGMYVAILTTPIGIILLLLFIIRPTKEPEKIFLKKLITDLCLGFLLANTIFLTMFFNSYVDSSVNQWH
ncbi:hypothetical protein [Sulfuriferula nivalis]|uniref:Uncharacterized protein n=1 Tax=Sulfuriferula nivalis TaxID=2675298 RepID=A0A809RGP1_9PROT|nr:hypothetical protein [Sulfuriferula nivalis]BBP00034.1 hypothetical protein SFSGTM_07420 [Sulfuriferula nivalis]